VASEGNEVGTARPRGRPVLERGAVERDLSEIAGNEIRLPEGAVTHGGPATCPACGSRNLTWAVVGTDKGQEELHPVVWDETEWLADTFLCEECSAGWIEPDDAAPITWVRPYWLVPAGT
jgi:hypothetical protein